MPVKVIDTLKPKNNGSFPVADAADIAVSDSQRLPAALDAKADASDLAATNAAVAQKADVSSIDSLQNQIDQIEITASSEAVVAPEVAAARVDSNGASFSTLKERMDSQQIDEENFRSEFYTFVPIEVGDTKADRGISASDGHAISKSGNSLLKYEVVAGTKVYLKLSVPLEGATYQFQNSSSVPTSGNTYVIGNIISGAVDSIVTVPTGATWLIVSKSNAVTTNIVSAIRSKSASDTTLSKAGYYADAAKTGTELTKKLDVPVASRNICDPNNKTPLYVPNDGGFVKESSSNISYYVEVKPHTDYTIDRFESTLRFGVGGTNKLENGAGAASLFYTTSISTNVCTVNSGNYKYLLIQMKTASDGAFPAQIQVEEGTTATDYVPYSGYVEGEIYALSTDGLVALPIDTTSSYEKNVNFGNTTMLSQYFKGTSADYSLFNVETLSSEIYNVFDTLAANNANYITRTDLGASSNGDHLYSYKFNPKRISNAIKDIPKIIIISGQHGFEKGAVFGLTYLMTEICNNWQNNSALDYFRNNLEFIIIPVVNRHGFDTNTYKNANGVNLNRNYDTPAWTLVDDPTADDYGGPYPFSEPESQIVRDLTLANTDALYFADWHTNGRYKATVYPNINWIPATGFDDDKYLSRLIDAISAHITSMTSHLTMDYNFSDIGDALCGYTTIQAAGRPTASAYAKLQSIAAHTFETNNGLPNGYTLDANCQKSNTEIFANWLRTMLSVISGGAV